MLLYYYDHCTTFHRGGDMLVHAYGHYAITVLCTVTFVPVISRWFAGYVSPWSWAQQLAFLQAVHVREGEGRGRGGERGLEVRSLAC